MSIEGPNNIESLTPSEDAQTQLENLGLTVDDIEGRVLDVGAGEGELGRELGRLINADVTSLDNQKTESTPDDVIVADVESLPFEDDSFDRVISHAAVPNVLMYREESITEGEIRDSIVKSFREIVRVIRPGSSAIMAPVRIFENQRGITEALEGAISEIREEGVDVSFKFINEVENPVNKEKCKQYRLTLFKKLKTPSTG